jgi:hypothetical protein
MMNNEEIEAIITALKEDKQIQVVRLRNEIRRIEEGKTFSRTLINITLDNIEDTIRKEETWKKR